jgi:urease beta subunit
VDGNVRPEVACVLLLVLVLALVLARLEPELDSVAAGERLHLQEDSDVRVWHADGEGLELVDVGGEEHVEGRRTLETGRHERVDDTCG